MRYLPSVCMTLALLCCFVPYKAQALSLKPNAPKEYIVQPGDTLWEIASKYLKNPWEWKQLWRANPDVTNPKHLYAGAVLILDSKQGKPLIKVLSNGTIKLSPHIRNSEAEEKVPVIPLDDIKPFLNESLILDENILSKAPYVVALAKEHMRGDPGNQVYVRGLHPSTIIPEGETIEYSLFRPGRTYVDPITKQILGYQATLVGYGELEAGGEPATVLVTGILEGIKKEDKVLINDSPEFSLDFEPSAPETDVNGLIIQMVARGMPQGTTQGAVGSIVVLNKGAQAGLRAGDVLGVYAKPRVVIDPKNHLNTIKLPPERIGEALVFRPFTKTSFAIIARSSRAIYLLDTVGNP